MQSHVQSRAKIGCTCKIVFVQLPMPLEIIRLLNMIVNVTCPLLYCIVIKRKCVDGQMTKPMIVLKMTFIPSNKRSFAAPCPILHCIMPYTSLHHALYLHYLLFSFVLVVTYMFYTCH